eukprot:489181_1
MTDKETRTNNIIAITYGCIQLTIAIIVSIIGAIHVRQCKQEEKQHQRIDKTITQSALSINDIETKSVQHNAGHIQSSDEEKETKQSTDNTVTNTVTNTAPQTQKKKKREKGFCELWIKTVWKMRGIYSGLSVHCFDVLTDILVIVQWLNEKNETGDSIDPTAMAWAAIAVLIFSKTISSIAIYIKEEDIFRAILQIFDLLIFMEIYEAHKKIVSNIKNKKLKDKNAAIESTLSFKYVRNFEAVFESIPQSVIQLVYVMRTSAISPIFAISILQSIISMTNSILNNDYTQMQEDKFAKHKQRMPPT